MPDARVAPEGTLRFGFSRYRPYSVMWSSVSFFPRMELSARYTEVSHVEALTNLPNSNFGDYKDKSFDAKLILLKESKFVPQVAVGTQDFFGTQVFTAHFVTLGKQIGAADITLGYGQKRLDGWFGGIHYHPKWLGDWSLLAEYDGNDYRHDRFAVDSGAASRTGKGTYGVNYRWGWLGAQVSVQDGDFGVNAYVSIPLMQNEFIPKLHEPKPYSKTPTRVPASAWRQADLRAALESQGFKNVRIVAAGDRLLVAIATPRITLVGRAVGRAVRTAMALASSDTRVIQITYYTLSDLPVVSYEFNDLQQLQTFFAGKLTYGELLHSLTVRYVAPDDVLPLLAAAAQAGSGDENSRAQTAAKSNARDDSDISTDSDNSDGIHLARNQDGHAVSLRQADKSLNSFLMTPFQIGVFFNDPSGALKYDWFAKAAYQRYFGRGLFFNTAARVTVVENVSDVVQPSNSNLPHVRTDVAEYKREKGVKIDQFLLNKYLHLRPRMYARWSVGIYEEMFAGSGGQLLYLPKDDNWGIDTSIDWLRQRDFDGAFGFHRYETVTALLNFHYRIPKAGVTLTARAGRFLAKDNGVRLEFARRFRSGFKIGAWYTRTDGDDITGPGSPGSPYFDKGVFIHMPLSSMLTRDTRAAPTASIRPWTRDVGQTVTSPGDLYQIMEDTLLFDRPAHHLLSGFHL